MDEKAKAARKNLSILKEEQAKTLELMHNPKDLRTAIENGAQTTVQEEKFDVYKNVFDEELKEKQVAIDDSIYTLTFISMMREVHIRY